MLIRKFPRKKKSPGVQVILLDLCLLPQAPKMRSYEILVVQKSGVQLRSTGCKIFKFNQQNRVHITQTYEAFVLLGSVDWKSSQGMGKTHHEKFLQDTGTL